MTKWRMPDAVTRPVACAAPVVRRRCIACVVMAPSALRRRLPGNRPRVDYGPVACDGPEPQRFCVDVNQQKRLFLIEGSRGRLRSLNTALAQLPTGADNEVGDPFLRLQPFIHVV